MSKTTETTRRSFLKSGAVIAAPIAATAAPAAALAADDSKAKLARLEDERAIEALNRDFLRRFNGAGADRTSALFADGKAPELARGVTRLALDTHAESEAIGLAEDGTRAHARIACAVDVEQALEGQETLIQMARLQGNAALRRTERRTLLADYVKGSQGWAIEKLRLA